VIEGVKVVEPEIKVEPTTVTTIEEVVTTTTVVDITMPTIETEDKIIETVETVKVDVSQPLQPTADQEVIETVDVEKTVK